MRMHFLVSIALTNLLSVLETAGACGCGVKL